MELRSGTLNFPSGTGERSLSMTFLFPREVVETQVALTGYDAHYDDGDHHIQRLTVKLSSAPGARVDEGFEARVTATFNLRDDNGDDPFSGLVSFLLFVQTRSVVLPPGQLG
jgi:hypothetical protein